MSNREEYLAQVRAKRAEKEKLIVPGSRWRHSVNTALVGTVERLGEITIEHKDGCKRVWLVLDGTYEEYRCPPEQIINSWEYLAPEPAPEPKPAALPGVRKVNTKRRSKRKGR